MWGCFIVYDFIVSDLQSLINNKKDIYVLEENRFIKNRKMSFNDSVFYLLGNKGKTSALELKEFNELINGELTMPPSKQNWSQQRTYISPLIFKDSNKISMTRIYSEGLDELETFKGLLVFAIDGSQFNIPNTPTTHEEFEVDLKAFKKNESPKARVSVLSDVKNHFIIDSTIQPFKYTEEILATENIENAKEIIDFSKSIIIFDRYYASTELIMQLLERNAYFIFRLKKDTYKNERNKMKTADEFIDININANRTQNIKNKDLKQKAKEIGRLHLRITDVELENGEIESLLTNLPKEIAFANELKELYGQRWEIEKTYDVLKNKLHIENFTGKRKITIEQDFYSEILMYNTLIGYRTEANRKLPENKKKDYKIDTNILAGTLKNDLIKIVYTEDEEKRLKLEDIIYKTAIRNLIPIKEKKKTERKPKKPKKLYPFNNRKNF